jgi:hypothetical protein
MLEYWNVGMLGKRVQSEGLVVIPMFHHSIIPSLTGRAAIARRIDEKDKHP